MGAFSVDGLIATAKAVVRRAQLCRYQRAGLQFGADLRLNGMPSFGTEPYLITLGDHVQISGGVTFLTHDGSTWTVENEDNAGEPTLRKFGRIVIDDNSFIGYGAIILPGVTIGPNSIVGAGAVVTRDVPPFSVAAGNPARRICSIDEFARRARERTASVDETAYATDKRAELSRIHPPPPSST